MVNSFPQHKHDEKDGKIRQDELIGARGNVDTMRDGPESHESFNPTDKEKLEEEKYAAQGQAQRDEVAERQAARARGEKPQPLGKAKAKTEEAHKTAADDKVAEAKAATAEAKATAAASHTSADSHSTRR